MLEDVTRLTLDRLQCLCEDLTVLLNLFQAHATCLDGNGSGLDLLQVLGVIVNLGHKP